MVVGHALSFETVHEQASQLEYHHVLTDHAPLEKAMMGE